MSNPVVRWQIISPKPQETSEFFERLFGWQSQTDKLLHYRAIDTQSEKGIQGGVWPAPPGVSPFVQLFIEVDDCAANAKSAAAIGATVLVPPQVLPDGDCMAILKDPQGLPFGIVQKRGE